MGHQGYDPTEDHDHAHLTPLERELLEACQTTLACIDRGIQVDGSTLNGLVVDRLRAAISKALGEAQ